MRKHPDVYAAHWADEWNERRAAEDGEPSEAADRAYRRVVYWMRASYRLDGYSLDDLKRMDVWAAADQFIERRKERTR